MRITHIAGAAVGVAAAMLLATPAAAHHNPPAAEVTGGDCGETTITTTWSADEHQVDTAMLVLLVDGEISTAPIGEPVTVGPFEADTTIRWRVWGGGERDYDDPPLVDLAALIEHLRDNPGTELTDAPGVAWHQVPVEGCPADDEEPTPTPSVEPTPPAKDDLAAGGDQGDDKLPVTGAPAALVAGAGVALLAAGGLVAWAVRRRGVTFTA